MRDASALAPVFVLGLTPVLEEAMPFAGVLWYSLPEVRVYEGLLEEACLEAGVPFLPVLDAFLEQPRWAEWLTADGLHGNSGGTASSLNGCAAGPRSTLGRACTPWTCRHPHGGERLLA